MPHVLNFTDKHMSRNSFPGELPLDFTYVWKEIVTFHEHKCQYREWKIHQNPTSEMSLFQMLKGYVTHWETKVFHSCCGVSTHKYTSKERISYSSKISHVLLIIRSGYYLIIVWIRRTKNTFNFNVMQACKGIALFKTTFSYVSSLTQFCSRFCCWFKTYRNYSFYSWKHCWIYLDLDYDPLIQKFIKNLFHILKFLFWIQLYRSLRNEYLRRLLFEDVQG